MGAQENLDTVKAIYEAFGRGDVDAILERVADDVDWASESAGSTAPWWGPRRTKDDIRGFFASVAETMQVSDFTPLSFAAGDDGDVFALIRFAFTSSATGKGAAMNIHHYWRFGDDGKVTYYRGSEDTAQVAAALTS